MQSKIQQETRANRDETTATRKSRAQLCKHFKNKNKTVFIEQRDIVLASFPVMLITTQCCRIPRSMMLKGQMTLSDY